VGEGVRLEKCGSDSGLVRGGISAEEGRSYQVLRGDDVDVLATLERRSLCRRCCGMAARHWLCLKLQYRAVKWLLAVFAVAEFRISIVIIAQVGYI
jgi:hypothetical protein